MTYDITLSNWTLSHPNELAPDRISSRWLMADESCHPDDLAGVGISSWWVTANPLCHPDDIPVHLMSSRWLNWGRYFIRMNYGNVIMSPRWDTLPFLCHPDDSKFGFFITHGGPTAIPYSTNRTFKRCPWRALGSTKTPILKANNKGFQFIPVSNLVCYSA